MVFLHLHSSVTKNKTPSKQNRKYPWKLQKWTKNLLKAIKKGFPPIPTVLLGEEHVKIGLVVLGQHTKSSQRGFCVPVADWTTTKHQQELFKPLLLPFCTIIKSEKTTTSSTWEVFKKKPLFFLGNLATHTNIPPSSFPQHHVQRRKYSKTSEKKRERVLN